MWKHCCSSAAWVSPTTPSTKGAENSVKSMEYHSLWRAVDQDSNALDILGQRLWAHFGPVPGANWRKMIQGPPGSIARQHLEAMGSRNWRPLMTPAGALPSDQRSSACG